MADLTVSGKMKVKTLKKDFKENFGCSLRVYVGKKFADDSATLASIRKETSVKVADLKIRGNMKVGSLEQLFKKELGITIQIANLDDTKLVSDTLTLSAAGSAANAGTKKAKPATKASAKQAPALNPEGKKLANKHFQDLIGISGLEIMNFELQNGEELVNDDGADEYLKVRYDVLNNYILPTYEEGEGDSERYLSCNDAGLSECCKKDKTYNLGWTLESEPYNLFNISTEWGGGVSLNENDGKLKPADFEKVKQTVTSETIFSFLEDVMSLNLY